MFEQFPVYITDADEIFVPENRENLSHSNFWRRVVRHAVAKSAGVKPQALANLPYCQRRGRVVGDRFYFGERLPKRLLAKIERVVGHKLVVVEDDHEKRLPYDVAKYRSILAK